MEKALGFSFLLLRMPKLFLVQILSYLKGYKFYRPNVLSQAVLQSYIETVHKFHIIHEYFSKTLQNHENLMQVKDLQEVKKGFIEDSLQISHDS